VIDPQATHRIMDGREDLHRHFTWIDALEFLVDFQNATKLLIEHLARQMGQIQIYGQPFDVDRESLVGADVEYLAGRDIARHQVAVLRVTLFENVITLGLGNRTGVACIGRLARHPHPSTFATAPFAHQSQLVRDGYCRWLDLNELAIAVLAAGTEHTSHGTS